MHKETAMRQIDAIYQTIEKSLQIALSSTMMIATGLAIAAVPLIELVLGATVDQWLAGSILGTTYGIFVIRTLFYWAMFWAIGTYFGQPKRKNLLLDKLFSVIKFFPLVPIATAAALALNDYSQLIAPMILIQVGCLYALYGQFSERIVTIVALGLISLGLAGIWLANMGIANLWMYLVACQGLAIALTGLALHVSHRTDKTA